ncbi:hypothetical protein HMPREF0322_04920 [Desulfitobacterium hafniense DP7]|uniref:Uncharacterized protein n=1 Tax=Desulfitobacterium hafniense DP7 TaxID=537010 RepID=G9XVA7_DESHA|nr:hypothetical protein HMPREF0322_04920 [Desulfitobacterium hafniense DP7]
MPGSQRPWLGYFKQITSSLRNCKPTDFKKHRLLSRKRSQYKKLYKRQKGLLPALSCSGEALILRLLFS